MWECAECGARDGHNGAIIDAACHHCGRLLCQQHAIRLPDRAFAVVDGETPFAEHCTHCKAKHHHRVRRGSVVG